VPADDRYERNGGFQVGDECPLDIAQIVAQVPKDAVDVDGRSLLTGTRIP